MSGPFEFQKALAESKGVPSEADFAPKLFYTEKREFSVHDKKITYDDLSEDQAKVLDNMVTSIRSGVHAGRPYVTLGGYAGTGKSTLIPLLAERLGNVRQTAFCSFTGKASNVLKRKLEVAGIKASDSGYTGTIHGLMYLPVIDERGLVMKWERRETLLGSDGATAIRRIIVDEASMVGTKLLDDLMSYDIPIVLVGDHGQLEPVMDDSVIGSPDFRLEKIHRQAAENPIIQLSQIIREKGAIPGNFKESEQIRFISKKEMGSLAGKKFDEHGLDMGLLVRSNKKRCAFNKTAVKGDVPRVGDILICLKNNPPIFNGMRGILEEIKNVGTHWYRVTIHFPDDGFRLKSIINRHQFNRHPTFQSIYDLYSDYQYPRVCQDMGLLFDFGMALTVHKAQGSAFEEAILCPEYWPKFDDEGDGYKRWLYTGVTRAAKTLYILR
jgi:exodeoxyribonuclease-5